MKLRERIQAVKQIPQDVSSATKLLLLTVALCLLTLFTSLLTLANGGARRAN